ncbi:hypothetical protein EHS25_005183 [Saitozyma podzolica]|uniref:Distal membrane-arm assembly complex protein 1-like domain-containing protein n=1 Tax=Saitozyma podzolica TaxID=1890683 RepID=A0A427XYK6_9TREE|nr:hypothetical protein EHS25_005183 [Saitozyma podzolica]
MSTTASPGSVKREKDCLPCRLTGAAAFTGLGGYAIYEASRQGTFRRVRPPGSPVIGGQVTAVIGLVFISLGIGRLVL